MAVRELIEIKSGIRELSEKTDTLLLAHCYCEPDVADVCDFAGSDTELLRRAAECGKKNIMVCGCVYLAEKIKLLRPDLTVTLASPQSCCPMSGQVCGSRVKSFLEEHPDACAVCDVVFPAALMALCSACITQRGAVEAISARPEHEILLIADSALAKYITARCPEKKITALSCRCPAFNGANALDIELARARWRELPVVANTMCSGEVTALADFAGSSGEIVEYCSSIGTGAIMADEVSVSAMLSRRFPERDYRQIAAAKLICSNMKRCDLEGLERALLGNFGTVIALPAISLADREHIAAMLRAAAGIA